MESRQKYNKHKTAEEALAAIKQCHKRYYEQNKEAYQAKEREKYRQEHPNHKVYKKREVTEYTTCKGKTFNKQDCARKIKVGTEFCWQHKNALPPHPIFQDATSV